MFLSLRLWITGSFNVTMPTLDSRGSPYSSPFRRETARWSRGCILFLYTNYTVLEKKSKKATKVKCVMVFFYVSFQKRKKWFFTFNFFFFLLLLLLCSQNYEIYGWQRGRFSSKNIIYLIFWFFFSLIFFFRSIQ